MPIYEVEVSNTQNATVFIKADSPEEAKQKYYDGEGYEDIDWDWEDNDEYVERVYFDHYDDDELE